MPKPAISLALLLVLTLIHLVAAETNLDGERQVLDPLSSKIEIEKEKFIGHLENKTGNLTEDVKDLSETIEFMLSAMKTLIDKGENITNKVEDMKNKVDNNSAMIANNTKCNASTCAAMEDTLKHIENCLADVNSTDCPHPLDDHHLSIAAIIANAEALAHKCNKSTCEAMEGKMADAEACLADHNSTRCPPAAPDKQSIRDQLQGLDSPTVFSCYKTEDITSTSKVDVTVKPFKACDVNTGNVVDITSGKFTVTQTGNYRLTFMSVMYPNNAKKVLAHFLKTAKDTGVETKLGGRSVAQSKLGTSADQVTTTLNMIVNLAAGDIVTVRVQPQDDNAKVLGSTSEPYHTYWTGEFITA